VNVSDVCTAGFYCKGGDIYSVPSDGQCQAGYYCPTGSAKPRPCPPGKACTTVQLGAPDKNCSAGYYCTSRATTATPEDDNLNAEGGNICSAGYYCPEASGWPLPCSAGTFNPNVGSSSSSACQACTAGSYCGSAGLAAPSGSCDAGYYCVAGSTSLRPAAGQCPAGSSCPTGSSSPTTCSTGTYQPFKGQGSCTDCPAGF